MPKLAALIRQLLKNRHRSEFIRVVVCAGDSDCGSSLNDSNDSNGSIIDNNIESDGLVEENLIDGALCKNALDDVSSRQYLFRENKYRNRRDVFFCRTLSF